MISPGATASDVPPSHRAGRLFLALPLPPTVRDELAAHFHRSTGGARLPGRPVPPENWHLTLRFLGETSAEQLDKLRALLDFASLGPPFRLTFGSLGAFSRPARAAVLWLGVREGEKVLGALAAAAESIAQQAGFPAETRPFAPHLTLSRLRPPGDVRALIQQTPASAVPMAATEIVLFRSELGSGPPRYTTVAHRALRSESR